MNKVYIFILILPLFALLISGCAEQVKDTADQNQTYGNTTENTKISSEKIDEARTYEVTFTIEKPVDCMTIEIESVYLRKSFPIQKVPQRTFFIVEKKLSLPQFKLKNSSIYSAMGRNFTNEWEIYSPVKMCSNKNDPIFSKLDSAEYRIRFTTFETTPFYYIIKVICGSKVLFKENLTPEKNKISDHPL